MKPDKVIFLDIDGPMIPYTSFLFNVKASFDQILDERCCKVLRLIIDNSGAKIVFNTTHNTMLDRQVNRKGVENTPGLIQRFVDAGFGDDIHEALHTDYPNVNRLDAINNWLQKNQTPNMLWVALDDAKIDHKRAFLVHPDHGIGIDAYNHCANYLMFKKFIVL